MKFVWIIGKGGLLGTAIFHELQRFEASIFSSKTSINWSKPTAELALQLTEAAGIFSSLIGPTDHWEIYWAAGTGTMSSLEDSLVPETQALAALLNAVSDSASLTDSVGTIIFSSSAGAIYAASTDDVITENTIPTPTTAYARVKLQQESLVIACVERLGQAHAVIARISTLYGPGQAVSKKQGLLTHIARCIVRNKVIQIYVPYDTIRDYIAADDAASRLVALANANDRTQKVIVKIIASQRSTTIAEIVATFERLAKKSVLVVTSTTQLTKVYSRKIQFRSIVGAEEPKQFGKSLVVGLSQVLAAERKSYVKAKMENSNKSGE